MDIFGQPSGQHRLCEREERGRHRFAPSEYRWHLPPLTAIPPTVRADNDPPPTPAPLKAYGVQGCVHCGLVQLLEYPNGRPFWHGWQHEMDDAIAAWNRS